METETLPIESIAEQKRRRRKKGLFLLLLISAHVDFYFALSIPVFLTAEQLFTFGQALIVTDTILLTSLIVKIPHRNTGASNV